MRKDTGGPAGGYPAGRRVEAPRAADRFVPRAAPAVRPLIPALNAGLLANLPAPIVGLLAFALYVRTLAPGVLAGDSGEFQLAAWLGGFVHPTGYPLYVLLGYAWTHLLGVGDPALRMNLFSAFWAGVAVGLVYLLTLQIVQLVARDGAPGTARPLLALQAALTFAVTSTFWSQAVIAEVYTLHAVFVAATLLGMTVWIGQPPQLRRRTLYITSVVYGLGLAHHRTMLLLAPAIVLVLWHARNRQDGWRTRLGILLRGAVLVGLPLLLYLYIPLSAAAAPYRTIRLSSAETLVLYQTTVTGFIAYITGRVFSSDLGTLSQATLRVLPAARLFLHEMSWPGVILGLIGLVWLGRRNRVLLNLIGGSFVALVVFNLFYGIGDIFVYYIPAYLIWTLWIALGVAAVGELPYRILQGRVTRGAGAPRWARVSSLLIAVLAFALPTSLLASNYAGNDQHQNQVARRFWQPLLAGPLPQGAILVSNDRDEMIPMWYMQYVEGIRTDLTGLFPLIQPTVQWSDVSRVIDAAIRTGRPTLLIKPMPGLDVKFRLETAGSLVRVAGPAVDTLPENKRSVIFGEAVRLNGYDLRPSLVRSGEVVTVNLYWQALHGLRVDYTTFVHLVNADGAVVGQSDHRPGGIYYPTSLWASGQLIKDVHVITLAQDLGRGPYAVEVGLYTATTTLQHLGNPERIGVASSAQEGDGANREPANRLGLVFDDQFALNGYDLSIQGNVLNLTLYWQTLSAPKIDYTVFVHVVGAQGNIVAQRDQQPAHGQVPTSTWTRGFAMADTLSITLPPDLAAGKYQLVAGIYDAQTANRLPVSDSKGRRIGDSAPLSNLVWPPGQ